MPLKPASAVLPVDVLVEKVGWLCVLLVSSALSSRPRRWLLRSFSAAIDRLSVCSAVPLLFAAAVRRADYIALIQNVL